MDGWMDEKRRCCFSCFPVWHTVLAAGSFATETHRETDREKRTGARTDSAASCSCLNTTTTTTTTSESGARSFCAHAWQLRASSSWPKEATKKKEKPGLLLLCLCQRQQHQQRKQASQCASFAFASSAAAASSTSSFLGWLWESCTHFEGRTAEWKAQRGEETRARAGGLSIVARFADLSISDQPLERKHPWSRIIISQPTKLTDQCPSSSSSGSSSNKCTPTEKHARKRAEAK